MKPRALLLLGLALACAAPAAAQRVGPAHGTVLVVGGGALGPEIYARFIAAAGGPDALIIDVPTAGGDSAYPADWRGRNPLLRAGARHVVVLHTVDRKLADSEAFVAPLLRAGGVWFEGGRQWHLVDSYAGTRTEREFHAVLERGGVVGGSSAGASILASYLLRGARQGNSIVMAPGYETGFGFLRGVAIDQHVVARERLRDLSDSLLPRHPELLGLSEDEGTAWVVQGDVAEIIGRNKAFAYGGAEHDPGTPFLTLHPGDRYDLGSRRLLHRAIEATALRGALVDSLMGAALGPGQQGTVLVAQDGAVLVDQAYGVPSRPNYLPTTTVPNFPLGNLSTAFTALGWQLLPRGSRLADSGEPAESGPGPSRRLAQALSSIGMPYQSFLARRIYGPIGLHRTVADTGTALGQFASNVDELYRLELGLQRRETWGTDSVAAADSGSEILDPGLGWNRDVWRGLTRYALFGEAGKRNAFVRIPERRIAVIILTDAPGADVRGISDRILSALLP